MYKIILALIITSTLLLACTSLTFHEQQELSELQYKGISIDRGPRGWQKPANPPVAGMLNILPGFGNFYLANGNASESSHWIYGVLNLLTWPLSIIWGVPEATIDADNINKRDMLNYLKYGNGSGTRFNNLENISNTPSYRTPGYNQDYSRPQPYRRPYQQAPRRQQYYDTYPSYGY